VDAVKISVHGNNGRKLLFEFHIPTKYTFTSSPMVVGRRLQVAAGGPAHPAATGRIIPQKQPHVVHLIKNAPITGSRVTIRPDLRRALISKSLLTKPNPDKQVLYQQVPSIRPPDGPPGTDQTWNEQMNNWLAQLNHVLLAEIQLVVEDENTVQNLINFEEGEHVSVYDQVGLRLYFLRLTQLQRTSGNPDEGNQ
jgi:hypothetical protein